VASATTTASVSGATLVAQGDSGADQITVTLPGGDGLTAGPGGLIQPARESDPYQVTDPAGVTAGAGCTAVSLTRADCLRGAPAPPWGSFTVQIDGAAGADWLQAIRAQQSAWDVVVIMGGRGDDALFGSQSPDVILGGAGDDLIDGGAGNDFASGGTTTAYVPTFEGGVSQPTSYVRGPGAGRDRVFGGAGSDQLTDGDVDASVAQPEMSAALLNSDALDGGVCPSATATSPGEPLPAGVPAPVGVQSCPSLPGNVDHPEDTDAVMWGHRTRPITMDLMILTASQGAAGENERLSAIEAVWAGSGDDLLHGLDGDYGDDILSGNAGNDRIEARGGDDELFGGDGQDTLFGGRGADVINPGGHIVFQTATTTTIVSDGPDHIDGGANSVIHGGHSQNDLVTYAGRTDALRLDLGAPDRFGAPGEADIVVGIEDVSGGHAADVIVGDALHNLLVGDPPPAIAVPPNPPLPAEPSGARSGDDHITTRDGGPDTVDCAGGSGDVHVADLSDASYNCEQLDRPPSRVGRPTDGAGFASAARRRASPRPAIIERRKKRRSRGERAVTVRPDGTLRLAAVVIVCPAGSGACAVRTTVREQRLPGRDAVTLGGASYLVRPGTKARAHGKLTARGLRLLSRRRSIAATMDITAVRGSARTQRSVRVRLLRPLS
jgi:hypothetical protein